MVARNRGEGSTQDEAMMAHMQGLDVKVTPKLIRIPSSTVLKSNSNKIKVDRLERF